MKKRGDSLRAWHAAQRAAKGEAAVDSLADPATNLAAEQGSGSAHSAPPRPAPVTLRPMTPRQVAARLAALDCDPLEIMAKLAKNRSVDPTLRIALARHLAAYQIAPSPPLARDKTVPALGDVIAAAWRRPKAAAQFAAKAKSKSAIVNAQRRAARRALSDKNRATDKTEDAPR